ncbi:MAG TPA: carcinine hydrolase/isopenicillin-N N-acyltransferase family protein, partial [Negativicutes bacterium]|nr:carcinine hydrolase/isopenicillin-N N-acyltransferase family protein [Negativicutes bacterium]
VIPARDGYKHFGLFVVDGEHKGLKAGINEKGLVVVTATAGSIPSKTRHQMPYSKSLTTRLLQECGGVDDVLARTDLFFGPVFLMIADRQKVATIEIGPEGVFSATVRQDGTIYHTNHYIDESMLAYNLVSSESSQTRFHRIAALLDSAPRPCDLDAFAAFARDQNDGPDNSIFRKGSTPRKTRTLATWAVRIPESGSPELHIRILNPGEEERVIRVNSDDVFSGKLIVN